jgi:hypothetical protein
VIYARLARVPTRVELRGRYWWGDRWSGLLLIGMELFWRQGL